MTAPQTRPSRVNLLLPGLSQFQQYETGWLRSDLTAGLTVAAYLVPQAMAYATLAGVSPVAGLWAALVPLAAYALLGSSRQLSVGPDASTTALTAATLAPIANGDDTRYAVSAAALAILVGIICLVGGTARLGFLANLLSRPILIGYMAGIALVMIAGQLGKITGTEVTGNEFIWQTGSFVAHLADVHWPTIALATAVVVVQLVSSKGGVHVPGPLIAVVLASAAVLVFSLQARGIAVVGPVPSGLPGLGFPGLRVGDLLPLLLPAAGIAIVAFSDDMVTARAFAARSGQEIDPNAEMRALGVCNIGAGLASGFPVSASGSRTAISHSLGSRTQLGSLTALAVVLIVLTFGGGLLSAVPMAALGALVLVAALQLIDVSEFRRLGRFRRSELVLALATTAAVLGLGVLYGVLAAVALSILDLLRRVARAHDSVLGFVPGVPGMHDVEDYPQAELVPGLVVYRYDAPLCFANAEDFRKRALQAVAAYPQPVEWFVLNAEANSEVDLTALDAVDRLRVDLARAGIRFAMARVKQDLREALQAAGMLDAIGVEHIYPTLPTAVAAFRQRDGAEG
ncbi:putative sulfate transporter [Mycolicibacterium vanbaalenii]|uniref:Putative sulfate transporter n=1 Tax=Mycolicibacterium vanbaalenii TaxID=110539 RepID=A0A5S9NU30_MYCVN|nr:sulfate permease [Mycolicibacterium vanbaalenii]CAA0094159.1 putative sulfate transporter [Mycolicibacterium vanbaalenii]